MNVIHIKIVLYVCERWHQEARKKKEDEGLPNLRDYQSLFYFSKTSSEIIIEGPLLLLSIFKNDGRHI
jgi:hypothetical protein